MEKEIKENNNNKINLKLSHLENRGNAKDYEDYIKEDKKVYGEDEEEEIIILKISKI